MYFKDNSLKGFIGNPISVASLQKKTFETFLFR